MSTSSFSESFTILAVLDELFEEAEMFDIFVVSVDSVYVDCENCSARVTIEQNPANG